MTTLEKTFSLANIDYRVKVIDDGAPKRLDPIVFISGAFQDMNSWKRYSEHFATKAKVILIDLPGTGQAELLPWQYGLDFLSDALHQAVRSLELERINIVSASYGTPIAFTLARSNPQLVNRLVMAGVMKEIPANVKPAIEYSLQVMEAGDQARFAHIVINGYTDDAGIEHSGLIYRGDSSKLNKYRLVERVLHSVLMDMDAAAQRKFIENTRRLLYQAPLELRDAPDLPVLVFTGEHDVFTLPEYCREIAAAFPRGIFTTIKNADHLFHIEQFPVSLDLIGQFLSGGPLEAVADCTPIEYSWQPARVA